ncbi:MAG: ABC transporter substrate-binding protein [Chloroflexi bacterium]|nr:ABC transporter substrate-binding protein [Chloroflexota bacterium]
MKGFPLPKATAVGLVILSLLLEACAAQPAALSPAAKPSPTLVSSPTKAAAAPQPAATAAPAAQKGDQLTKVRLGVLSSLSDSGNFIAQEKGYFKQQGLDVEFIRFGNAAEMIAPLGAGQLDVGGGAPGVGLANAIARNVDIKIVADKGSTPKGNGFEAIVVRKDLWDAGVRKPADFKGKRVAIPSTTGITPEAALDKVMRTAGLKARDLELAQMAHPDMAAALAGKSIDLAIPIEPHLTKIVNDGLGVIYQREDEFYPNHQIAVILYSGKFMKENPDAAKGFMIAYLRAVRDYNDAFAKKDAKKKAEVVSILTKSTAVKDPALYDKMIVPGLNPNGEVFKASLPEDQDYFIRAGLQETKVDVDKLVDSSFVKYAVEKLGVYK